MQQRAIKDHLQLITLSNDCFLFPRQKLESLLHLSFNLWENTKNPIKETFLTEHGIVTSFSRERQIISYAQKFKSEFIDKQGRKYDNSFDFGSEFPPRLYVEFVNLKNKKELENSKLFQNFCAFPSLNEARKLYEAYKKAGFSEPPFFIASKGYEKSKKQESEIRKMKERIRKINIDFVWTKKQELEKNIIMTEKNGLSYDKLQWLNREQENISNFLIDQKSYIWEKITEEEIDKRDLKEAIGIKNIKNKEISLMEAKRVYGHFALCCLEIYQDIFQMKGVATCEFCGKYFLPNKRRNEKYCKDPECHKSRKAFQKSTQRAKNKNQ